MNTMLSEIYEIPAMAQKFLAESSEYVLPNAVPYLGMGSSYFAPLAFKYMGVNIYPEMASEFFNYQYTGEKLPSGVLLSQSGKSTEVLWCTELFEKYTAITNNVESPLCKFSATSNVINLLAGEEQFSSSKTYINTLLALFKGLGFDVKNAVQLLVDKMHVYEEQGNLMANRIFEMFEQNKGSKLYITGSGPNIGTAMQAALIMSESTRLNFNGLPMAQYDHGPKETANDSIVINIIAKGKSEDRSRKLCETIKAAGAHVFTVEERDATENESILHNIVPFNFMAYYLSLMLNVETGFVVGNKITEVDLL
jgi:glucosamine--fructose-6-phosphate aminotransferase (isomerizing)